MTAAPARGDGRLTVALISEVFWQPDGAAGCATAWRRPRPRRGHRGPARDPAQPVAPRDQGAVDEDDAEPMGGPRMTTQQRRPREAGIGLVGGIIHRDAAPAAGRSRALIFDRAGELVGHLREAPPPRGAGLLGDEPLRARAPRRRARIDAFGLPIGVQICSDTNRPEGTHLLGAQGAERRRSSRAPPRRRPTSAGRSSSAPTR